MAVPSASTSVRTQTRIVISYMQDIYMYIYMLYYTPESVDLSEAPIAITSALPN